MLRWLVGGLVVAAVVILVAAFYPNENGADRGPAQTVGKPLPALSFPSLSQGQSIDLNALHGRDVLLNVWATWCGPCRREMPALQMLSGRMQDRLLVVAVDQGEDPAVVGRYVRQFGVRFPVGVDREQRLGTALHLIGMPSSFFIDRNGIVRDAVDGEMTYGTMSEKAQTLLAADTERTEAGR